MPNTRRTFLAASTGLAAHLLEPLRQLEAAVRPVRITDVDIFRIEIPIPEEQVKQGRMNRYTVCRIDTDAGVRGYSFAGPDPKLLDSTIRPALVGQDLFAIERHLEKGAGHWNGLEHAIWDAIGKIANRPVYELLGGGNPKIKVYLTTVWFGNQDQSHVPYDEQAAIALKFKQAGFKGMKIRAWRPNPMDDTEACRAIRDAVGPDFAIMFDRTAHAPESVGQQIWDYETALRVARAFEDAGAYWLEEPFARDDFVQPAKLAREVDMPITARRRPLRPRALQRSIDARRIRHCSAGKSSLRRHLDLPQGRRARRSLSRTLRPPRNHGPDARRRTADQRRHQRRVARVRLHPAALCYPEEVWSPGLQVLNTKEMYRLEDGHIHVPDLPGIGLDVDEEASREVSASDSPWRRSAPDRAIFTCCLTDSVCQEESSSLEPDNLAPASRRPAELRQNTFSHGNLLLTVAEYGRGPIPIEVLQYVASRPRS